MDKKYMYRGSLGFLEIDLEKKEVINRLDKEKMQLITHKNVGKDNYLILDVLTSLIKLMFLDVRVERNGTNNSIMFTLENAGKLYINVGENKYDELKIEFI